MRQRQRQRERDREKDRETERQRERETERDRERQRDRETERDRDRDAVFKRKHYIGNQRTYKRQVHASTVLVRQICRPREKTKKNLRAV